LERAVLQAGGNPYRTELLHDDAHIALALEANTAYARACEHGDAKGCAQSGDVLLSGRLVSEDVVKGAALIAKSCDLGLASGCASWGQILERGRQASRAIKTRISVLPGGAGQTITEHVVDPQGPAIGDRDSCLAAARCFAEDPPTQAHALDLLARECELGIAFACSSAAHLSGMMTLPRDAPGADEWHRRACALGWAADCRKR
jgi:TPR repeat protein